jgi:hypothetical protein
MKKALLKRQGDDVRVECFRGFVLLLSEMVFSQFRAFVISSERGSGR